MGHLLDRQAGEHLYTLVACLLTLLQKAVSCMSILGYIYNARDVMFSALVLHVLLYCPAHFLLAHILICL